jgi:hypothetical protein
MISSFIIHWEYDLPFLTLPILANLYHQGDVHQQFSQRHGKQIAPRKLPHISSISLSYQSASTGQLVPLTKVFPTGAEAGWRKLCFARFWVVPVEDKLNSLLSYSSYNGY